MGVEKSPAIRKLAVIHVAKKQLCLEEDTYRAMLKELTGQESSKGLTEHQLDRVLNHLKKKGFKVKSPSGKRVSAAGTRKLDTRPDSKKIRAIWLMLHELGAVRDPSEAALASYVKRMTGVDDMHWVRNDHDAVKLIETMKKWALRFLPARCKDMAAQIPPASATDELQSVFGRAAARGTYDPYVDAYYALKEAIRQPAIRPLQEEQCL